jgi:hypothetical protein
VISGEHEAEIVAGLHAQLAEEQAAWERYFVWAACERVARTARGARPELFERTLVRPPAVTGRLRSERDEEARRLKEHEERMERELNRDDRERLRLWERDGIETASDHELRMRDEADDFRDDDSDDEVPR